MASQSPQHVNGCLEVKVLGIVRTLDRRRNNPVFLVVGYSQVVGVVDTLEELNTDIFDTGLFRFFHLMRPFWIALKRVVNLLIAPISASSYIEYSTPEVSDSPPGLDRVTVFSLGDFRRRSSIATLEK